jgi:cytochrome c oxidase cbb3-type subunit III
MKFRHFSFLFALFALSCEREERGFRVDPPSADTAQYVTQSDIIPGATTQPASTRPVFHANNRYEENAYAMSEGKRLYSMMNCVGCHANGGGGMGPALMDEKWIYGNKPEQVFATIVEGRPNGMPAFRGKLPDYQVWQLSAYVRSMSGLSTSRDAAPGRDDHMNTKEPENSIYRKDR